MSKNIFIVQCDLPTFEKSFSRKKNTEIINRHEVYQKLTNNDISKTPPTEEIVDYQIIKKLNNFRDCKKTEFVFIYQEEIDKKFINNIKRFFANSEHPVFYHLLMDREIKNPKLLEEFNTFQHLEDDKVRNS